MHFCQELRSYRSCNDDRALKYKNIAQQENIFKTRERFAFFREGKAFDQTCDWQIVQEGTALTALKAWLCLLIHTLFHFSKFLFKLSKVRSRAEKIVMIS